MSHKPPRNSGTQNIVIPNALFENLGQSENSEAWQPRRPSVLPTFSHVKPPGDRFGGGVDRSHSIAVDVLSRSHLAEASLTGAYGRYADGRKTSVPTGRASVTRIAQHPPSTEDLQSRGRTGDGRSWAVPTGEGFGRHDMEAQSPPRRRTTMVQNVQGTLEHMASRIRNSSIYDVYEKAKQKGETYQRQKWAQVLFECTVYAVLVAFVYLVLIGLPIWKGAVYWLWWVVSHKFVISGGFAITVGLAAIYAFAPLLIGFEKYPVPRPAWDDPRKDPKVQDTALLIPCYKSADLISNTLKAATRVFPPSNIFVIANGNSPTPLDNTEEKCSAYGVNHIWSPVGSKIVAQFVGCFAAKTFKNVLLIDDDCALPSDFPVVSDRMTDMIKCIGYTIKSVGPGSSKGTLCQQAQDLEYKLSGLQRAFAGKIGSATFPHGAIVLWDRKFLVETFYKHPGFSVSGDWFFGHVARLLGSRIIMCTSVFVETETPTSVFFAGGGARGGFGEMTIFQQRFKRWNFFFVNGMWYNMSYIVSSWKLGWWEFGAKLFVFQEVYETLLYLLTPFVLPISFIVRPSFCGYLLASTVGLYLLNVIIFKEYQLRRKNERVGSLTTYLYYMPYKVALTFINVVSCYWSLYKYARYFARRHPKIIDDEKAVEVVLRLEEQRSAARDHGRRMTVTTIGVQVDGNLERVSIEHPETISEESRPNTGGGTRDSSIQASTPVGNQISPASVNFQQVNWEAESRELSRAMTAIDVRDFTT